MDADELRQRTKTFGLRILKLADSLPTSVGAQTIAGRSFAQALPSVRITEQHAALAHLPNFEQSLESWKRKRMRHATGSSC